MSNANDVIKFVTKMKKLRGTSISLNFEEAGALIGEIEWLRNLLQDGLDFWDDEDGDNIGEWRGKVRAHLPPERLCNTCQHVTSFGCQPVLNGECGEDHRAWALAISPQ